MKKTLRERILFNTKATTISFFFLQSQGNMLDVHLTQKRKEKVKTKKRKENGGSFFGQFSTSRRKN